MAAGGAKGADVAGVRGKAADVCAGGLSDGAVGGKDAGEGTAAGVACRIGAADCAGWTDRTSGAAGALFCRASIFAKSSDTGIMIRIPAAGRPRTRSGSPGGTAIFTGIA